MGWGFVEVVVVGGERMCRIKWEVVEDEEEEEVVVDEEEGPGGRREG